MPMIRETIVTTVSGEGRVHIAPLGLIAEGLGPEHLGAEGEGWIIAPFRPSTTLDNLRSNPFAVANFTDDVLIFAGCLTGKRDWPTRPATLVPGVVLEGALAHAELEIVEVEEDEQRPRFHCRVVHRASHAPFKGFNRAQAAVIEAAILASRLHMLPRNKIEHELAYLQSAVEKTGGPREHEAWRLLVEKIEDHFKGPSGAPKC
ncbi:MAG: DUF447 domain-containing protein [Methyloceanibacter sp.]